MKCRLNAHSTQLVTDTHPLSSIMQQDAIFYYAAIVYQQAHNSVTLLCVCKYPSKCLYTCVCVRCAYGTMIVFAVFNELQLSVAMPSHISSIACNIILHLLSFSPPMAHDVIQASRLATYITSL